MWTTYKTKKDGETLEAIAKAHKLSDAKPLISYPKNKKLAEFAKKKKPLPKGTAVTVPDLKVKCFSTKVGGKQVVMTEAEWKTTQARLDKAMLDAAKMMRRRLDALKDRQQQQQSINREFFWVHQFSRTWFGDEGTEPISEVKAAEAAVKALESVAKGKKYKEFEKAAKESEKALNAYSKKLHEWIEKLIGGAGNAATALTWTRDISFVVFGAAAMTVAAPVGVAATLGAGLAVGAGTASMEGMATEAGHMIASNAAKGDPYNFEKGGARLKKKIAIGALGGIVGAGATKFLGRFVVGRIAAKLADTKYVVRFVGGVGWFDKWVLRMWYREAEAIASKAAGTIMMPAHKTLASNLTAKFIHRLGMGSIKKLILTSPKIIKYFEKWIQDNAAKIDPGKPEEIGKLFADAIDDQMMTDMLEILIKDNQKALESELCAAFRDEIKKAK